MEHYPPHTYRHLAIRLAFKKAKNPEETKAISQNFGHEHIATTFSIYGNYQKEDLIKKLTDIDTRKAGNPISSKKLEKIKKILDSDDEW